MTSTASSEIDFERFAVSVRKTNPFSKNRVSEVQDAAEDVACIHDEKFRELTRRIAAVREGQVANGILLLGAAGLGKSHLLGRLSRWARQDGRATLVFLHNVLASPDRMAFYLLKATLSALAGQRPGCDYAESELYAVLNRAVQAEMATTGHRGSPPLAHRLQVLERLGRRIDPAQTVMPVLLHFVAGTVEAAQGNRDRENQAQAAIRWLSGEDLEKEDAAHLGIRVASSHEVVVADEARVESVFRVLAALSGVSGRPLALCIDQVDNLQAEQVSALAAFLHVLIDHTPNLSVVVSGIKETMLRLRENGTISEAAWDRLAEYIVTLPRIQTAEARQILEQRLEGFFAPFRALDAVQRLRSNDPLFPLGEAWFSDRVSDVIEVRPRDVITWARDRWEEQQLELELVGADAWQRQWKQKPNAVKVDTRSFEERVDEEVRKKFTEVVAQRALNRDSLPPDGDNLATLVKTLLAHCEGDPRYTLARLDPLPVKKNQKRAYDFSARERRADGTEVTNGLCFLGSDTPTGTTYALRRILEDPDPPDHRILVTDEERSALKLGPRGREVYKQLCDLGKDSFLHAKLRFVDHAELDALVSVIGAARVGDVEVADGTGQLQRVTEDAVVESLHRQKYFLSHSLLRELLTEQATSGVRRLSKFMLNDQRARETIRAELAWRLGMTTREATEVFLRHEKIDSKHFEDAHTKVKEIAEDMHRKNLVFATAQDDELFLQFRLQS